MSIGLYIDRVFLELIDGNILLQKPNFCWERENRLGLLETALGDFSPENINLSADCPKIGT